VKLLRRGVTEFPEPPGVDDPMRVVLLGPYPPPHGGVQTHLVALQRFLQAHGISCVAVNLTRFRRESVSEIRYPKSAWELMRLLLTLPADVLHLHFGGHLSLRLLSLALFCSVLPGRRTVLTLHSGGYPSSPAGQSARRRTLRSLVLRRLDRIIAVNQEIAGVFRRFGVEAARIRLIPPHALDVQPADALTQPLLGFFATHRPVLVSVGGLEPEYDPPLQVGALEQFRTTHPDAGLILIGSGSLEHGLRSKIESSPFAAHVMLCGDVPHAMTLKVIAEADVLLRTTHYDGDSIAVREALDLGTPVVATDNGQRPEGVVLIPRSSVAALVAAVESVLADSHQMHRLLPPALGNLEAVLAVYIELLPPAARLACDAAKERA